jgi:Flp pilus assembly pilin Flp
MINIVVSWIQARMVRQDGQDLVEYALLSGLIAFAIIAVIATLSGALTDMITGIGNCIDFDGLNCT